MSTNLSGERSDDSATILTLQPDGKIVVAGVTSFFPSNIPHIALARYNTDGSLDLTFGSEGKVITDFGGSRGEGPSALVFQRDGKILVAGGITTDVGDNFLVARFNTDGGLDASFGSGGRVTTEFNGFDRAHALGLQSDGKIVVVGASLSRGSLYDFALARYNPDGSLDASFGSGGKVITDIAGGDDAASGLALQSDGKIVVLGGWSPPPPPGCCTFGPSSIGLVRYNPDGTLDASFGTGGKVTTGLPFFAFTGALPRGMALQPDGKIVIVTSSTLTRFNLDGTLDPTFPIEPDGLALPSLQPDGKIVLATAGKCLSSTVLAFCPTDFDLTRFNPDGTPDLTFGNKGTATTDFPGSMFWPSASALAIQPDGKIVVAGTSTPFGGSPNFALARFEGDPFDGSPILGLHLSRRIFNPNDTLRMDVTVTNLGPAFDADLYFGALLPDGETLVFVTKLAPPALAVSGLAGDARSFRPLITNVHMPEGFIGEFVTDFRYTFSGGEPPGDYIAFAALVKPGSFQDGRIDPGDILMLAVKPFTFSSGLTVPTPISPINDAAFESIHTSHGICYNLFFDWTDSHSFFGIFGYFVSVERQGAPANSDPFLFRLVTASELTATRCLPFDHPVDGWGWRVQAIDNLGNVSPWSDPATFRLER